MCVRAVYFLTAPVNLELRANPFSADFPSFSGYFDNLLIEPALTLPVAAGWIKFQMT